MFSPPVEILTRACFDWFLTDSNSLLAALSEAPYYNEEVLPPVIQELERYEICPGGDVTLVAENEFLKVKIVVSSLVLSLASDVFKALFGPNFKEGQGLGYTNPDSRTVPLGEDDPNALLLFCQVLHNRASEHDLDNVHHEEIVELATLVDKYNCGEAFLAHAYKFLAAPLVEDDSIVARSPVQADSYRVANLAVAAYLFNNPRFFLKYTRMLVLDRPMGWKTDTHPIADYLPATSLGMSSIIAFLLVTSWKSWFFVLGLLIFREWKCGLAYQLRAHVHFEVQAAVETIFTVEATLLYY